MSIARRRIEEAMLDRPLDFEDEEVKRICVENFGGADGITDATLGTVGVKGTEGEITLRQALAVKTIAKGIFSGNTVMRTFRELKLFRNAAVVLGSFTGCTNLEAIHLGRHVSRNGENYDSILSDCPNLKEVDVEDWDTASCRYFVSVFANDAALKSVDVSGWKTDKSMMFFGCFQKCTGLTELDVSSWDVRMADNIASVFSSCTGLTRINIDGKGWQKTPVTTKRREIYALFSGCTALKEIQGIEQLNTENVTNMTSMFHESSSLEEIDLSAWVTSAVTGMADMFGLCSSLKRVVLGGIDTRAVTDFSYMFNINSLLTSVENSAKLVRGNATNLVNMFYSCSALEHLDTSAWDLGKVSDATYLFCNCESLKELDASSWNLGESTEHGCSANSMFMNCSSLTGIGQMKARLNNMFRMFLNCEALKSIDVTDWRIDDCDNFSGLFNNCTSLEEIKGVENLVITETWTTANCMNMFRGCSSLKELHVPDLFSTEIRYGLMACFYGCTSLKYLDLSNANLRYAYGLSWDVFSQCGKLKDLYLGPKFFCSKNSTEKHTYDLCVLTAWQGESVRKSLVTDLYDRASEGLEKTYIKLNKENTIGSLTADEIETIKAKGYHLIDQNMTEY